MEGSSKNINPVMKCLGRRRHRVWDPTHCLAIKKESINFNHDCLSHTIQVMFYPSKAGNIIFNSSKQWISQHFLMQHQLNLSPRLFVLRPSQPNGVMSSAVSLPNHTFTGQA